MNTIFLILFLLKYPALSLEITKQNQPVNVYENVQYYKELGNATFEINRLENAKFTSEKHQVYHQLSGNTLWMRIQINNTTSEALSYYFSSYNAYLPEGQLFIKNANGIWEGHLHNYRNQLEANTYFNNPTWFVNLIPGESTLYFKFFDDAKRTRTLVFLLSPKEFKVWRIKSIGFLVFMVLSALVLVFIITVGALYVKTPYFLFYALYLIGLLVDFLAYKGWGAAYLWQGNIFLLDNIRSSSNSVSSFAICFFFYRFYKDQGTPPWTNKIFQFMGFWFATMIVCYGIKIVFGVWPSLFLVVFNSIQVCAGVIILIHTFLGFKKYVPLYLPLVFILHTLCIVVQVRTNFPIYGYLSVDSLSVNMYYYTLILELGVLTYYILKKMWTIKENNEQMAVQLKRINEKRSEIEINKAIFIKLKSKALINLSKIYYIKSDNKFLEFHTEEGREIERETLKNIQVKLPQRQFVQIHKSFIVNLFSVRAAYSNKVLLKNGDYLPVSRSHKQSLQKVLSTTAQKGD